MKMCRVRADRGRRSGVWFAASPDVPDLRIIAHEKERLIQYLKDKVPEEFRFISVGFHENGIATDCIGIRR